jgi:hypothetical protein
MSSIQPILLKIMKAITFNGAQIRKRFGPQWKTLCHSQLSNTQISWQYIDIGAVIFPNKNEIDLKKLTSDQQSLVLGELGLALNK